MLYQHFNGVLCVDQCIDQIVVDLPSNAQSEIEASLLASDDPIFVESKLVLKRAATVYNIRAHVEFLRWLIWRRWQSLKAMGSKKVMVAGVCMA